MTQEDKELLLKDLCARLPYDVKIRVNDKIETVEGINILDNIVEFGTYMACDIDEVKPYLFPLSSISEDQKYDFHCRFIKNDCNFDDFKKFLYNGMWRRKLLTFTSLYDIEAIIDWFHKNHIDYRDLILMGLAIDATGLNI